MRRVLYTIEQDCVSVLSKIFHRPKFRHKIMFFTNAFLSQSEQPSISLGTASLSEKASGRTELTLQTYPYLRHLSRVCTLILVQEFP